MALVNLAKHLSALVLALNKGSRGVGKTEEPISNAKLFELFREILLIETKRDELDNTVFSDIASTSTLNTLLNFTGKPQPNFAQPSNGIFYFDQTLKRFGSSENTRKYFDSFPREGCRVYNNAAFSVANNAYTAVTFNSERFDPFDMHSVTVNTSRVTIPRTGRYVIGGSVEFASSAVGYRGLGVRLNGTTLLSVQNGLSLGAVVMSLNVNTVYELAVNDYVELVAFQNSGGALNVGSVGNYSPEFYVARVHDQPV